MARWSSQTLWSYGLRSVASRQSRRKLKVETCNEILNVGEELGILPRRMVLAKRRGCFMYDILLPLIPSRQGIDCLDP